MMRHHADANNEPAKEVRQWNGIPLNITTKTGEPRFSFAPPMTCDYGCIRGTWGAGLDGKALDVYVVSDAPTVFKVVQVTPSGAIDEYKYILGAQNFDEAVETFLKHVPKQLFGAASQYSIGQLQGDMAQQSKVKKDADELAELVQQLETLIESDDAYGSNVSVLSFEVADNGDIAGKFKDAWNGRVFTYSVEKDRIGYKPALKLDRVDSAVAAKRFDIFSSGYTSLQVRQDAIKSGKKPRCTAISYGCGRACIQLKNTCWINSSGQKVKKAGGAVASISQGRIDKLRVLARYLAANGNSKWSKYGGAELLAAKAGNLEAKRANLFERSATKQTSKELSPIEVQAKTTTKILEPQEKKTVRSKPESVNSILSLRLSNSEFEVVDDKTARSKLEQWNNLYKSLEKQQINVDKTARFISNITYAKRRKNLSEELINNIESSKTSDPIALAKLSRLKAQLVDFNKEITSDQGQIKKIEEKYLKANQNTPLIDKNRLEAVTTILDALFEVKKDKKAILGGVTDKDGNLQAAYSYTNTLSGYKIDFLASAPWNCLPDHPNKKAGAGASAIEGMVKDILSKNKEGAVLELFALPDAVPFYEKIGFAINNDKKGGLPHMILSKENAQRFIEKQKSKNRQDAESVVIVSSNLDELDQLEDQALGLFTVSPEIYEKIRK